MTGLINSLDGMLSDPYLEVMLISLFIKSTILIVAAGMAIRPLRRSGPVVRNLILTLAFVILLVLPLLMIVIPAWRLPVYEIISSPSGATIATINGPGMAVPPISNNIPHISIFTIIVLIWAIGTLVLLIRLMLGWVLMRHIIMHSKSISNDNAVSLINHLRARLGYHRDVRLVYSSGISSPQVFGFWKPRIILPEDAPSWTKEKLEMALIHELAHIKRHDTLWYMIGSAVCALYWFNPLVWIYRRKLADEAEIICDDYVLLSGSDAFTYAENLLALARRIGKRRLAVPLGASMIRKSKMEDRLMSIMSNRSRRTTVKNSVFAIGCLFTLALVLPLSAAQMFTVGVDDNIEMLDMYAQAEPSEGEGKIMLAVEKKQEGTTIDKTAGENYPGSDEFIKVTTPAEMITGVEVTYPEEAEKQKIEGDVWVKALVDTTGSVKDVRIMKTSGSDLLDKAATKSAYGCKFKPALVEDKPVAVWVSYKMTFTLDDKVKKQN